MNRALATLFLTVFLDLLGFGLVVPFLPRNARELGANDFVAAALGASYSLAQLVCVPLWGRLSDRIGRRPVLLMSIGATCLAMLALAFANSLPTLFATRIFAGMATANIAVAQAYIADVTPPNERSRGMALIGIGFGLGFIFGPLVGGQLAAIKLWGREATAPAFVAAGLSAINLMMAVVLIKETRVPKASLSAEKQDRWSNLFSNPSLTRSLLVNFLFVSSFSGLEQTFTLFVDDSFKLTAKQTGMVFGLIGVVAALVQGGMIRPLTKRFGEVQLIRAGTSVQVISFGLVAASPLLGLPTLYAACVMLALGSGLTTPSVSSFVSQQADPEKQGEALGMLQGVGALSRVMGPLFAGTLYSAIGPSAPYVTSAIGMFVAAITAMTLVMRQPATSPLESTAS